MADVADGFTGNVVLKTVDRDGRAKKGQHNNPYYNVVVDDAIISGHSEIWRSRFIEFVSRLIAVQDARRCGQYLPEPSADAAAWRRERG